METVQDALTIAVRHHQDGRFQEAQEIRKEAERHGYRFTLPWFRVALGQRDWDAAFHRHDVAFIDRLLADEFVVTYDTGVRADRNVELQLATTVNENIESSTMDEFIVKEFGNTAVVWFTLHLVGPVKGERVQNNYRFTDVFVLRDGRWQCVSSQSTKVASP